MSEAEVFICYSRRDIEWKHHVNRFMETMQRAEQFRFSYWDDGRIKTGDKWEEEIQNALSRAKAALLLISADFLSSKFILEKEVPEILRRAEEGGLKIFPLLVRPCPWESFKWLRELELANETDKILSGCTLHRVEEILTGLMLEIGQHIDTERASEEAPEETSEDAVVDAALGKNGEQDVNFERPIRDGFHEEHGKYGSFLTNTGVVHLIEHSPANPGHSRVIGLICIFRTLRQRTWFVATESDLHCVLDDEKTAAGSRREQWRYGDEDR